MNIKSFAIVLKNNSISELGFKNLLKSVNDTASNIDLNRFDAVTPNEANHILNELNLKWNYPWEGSVIEEKIYRLKKSAYSTRSKEKRIACSLSHYILWKRCIELNEPILIFEHDAVIIKTIPNNLIYLKYDVTGINDPRGATRKANVFHNIVQNSKEDFISVPIIDDLNIPQGLAGNSAYIIKPSGAERLLYLCKELGLWPNDAIMCQQLVPNMGVTKTYYTKVQGLQSTTSL